MTLPRFPDISMALEQGILHTVRNLGVVSAARDAKAKSRTSSRQGLSGHGIPSKADLLQMCSKHLKDPDDELYLFGFSRGACKKSSSHLVH